MKTLLLTGASGFIGQHLLRAVEAHAAFRTYKIVLLSSQPHERHTTILRNGSGLSRDRFLEQGVDRVDLVIHAGAFIPKKPGDVNDWRQCTSNITALEALLLALPSAPEKFLFFSTVDVYGPSGNQPINEATPPSPVSLYGWSKLYGEELLAAWARQSNVVLQLLRIGHIHGSGEEAYEKLIPLTIRKVLNHQSPTIFSTGEELRSFLHISDCVTSVLAACDLEQSVGPINVVSAHPQSIKSIVQAIVDRIDPTVPVTVQNNDVPVRNLVFDNAKMAQHLAAERMPFADGIQEEIKAFAA